MYTINWWLPWSHHFTKPIEEQQLFSKAMNIIFIRIPSKNVVLLVKEKNQNQFQSVGKPEHPSENAKGEKETANVHIMTITGEA